MEDTNIYEESLLKGLPTSRKLYIMTSQVMSSVDGWPDRNQFEGAAKRYWPDRDVLGLILRG